MLCYFCIHDGKLVTWLYDKKDDFNFPIVNLLSLSNNILSVPAYVVYVSQLVRYTRVCCKFQDFVDRGKLCTNKLLSQSYRRAKLESTLK